MNSEVDRLFSQLDRELSENVDRQYFQEPREFRSLIEVLAVVNEQVDQMNRRKDLGNDLSAVLMEDTSSRAKLDHQLEISKRIIEEIVSFQQGGLNNSLDTMSEVVKEYNRSREEIHHLRKSLVETQTVLTAKKTGQVSLKELWGKRVELKETLRMVRELEELKNFPLKANRLLQQKRYLTTAKQLKAALEKIFSEDFARVGGVVHIREQLFTLKEKLLESSIEELKESIVHFHASHAIEHLFEEMADDSDDEAVSEMNGSVSHSQGARFDETASAASNSRRPSNATTMSAPPLPPSGMNGAMTTHMLSSNPLNAPPSEQWSYNLRDVNEAVESSLIDPSATGALFIRLLVKSIGHLHFEDDVEHLLDETIVLGFWQSILPQVKAAAEAKLARVLQQHGSADAAARSASEPRLLGIESPIQDEELRIHSRLFNEYISLLLEMMLGIFQRFIYVYKLLAFSKYDHARETAQETPRGGRGATGIAYDSDYLSNEAQVKILTMLTKIILQVEEFVQQEMQIHLIEADVQNISDIPSYSTFSQGKAKANKAGEDEEEDEAAALRDKTIFRSSVWHAAFLYTNLYKYNYKLYKLLTENFDEEPLISVIKSESSLMSAEYESNGPGGVSHRHLHYQKPNHLATVAGMSQHPHQNSSGGGITITAFTSSLLPFIRTIIETEFIPVVQSWVNQELRELMENHSVDNWTPTTAASMIEQRQKLFHLKFQVKQQMHDPRVHSMKTTPNSATSPPPPTITQASLNAMLSTLMIQIVFSTCQLLLTLWNQLFDHRDFLVVVYDRFLKTVHSLLQENQEYLINRMNLITFLAKISFQPYLRRDWNYQSHQQRSMIPSFQQLMDLYAKIQMNTISSSSSISTNAMENPFLNQYSAFILPGSASISNTAGQSSNPLAALSISSSPAVKSSSTTTVTPSNKDPSAQSEQPLHQIYLEEFVVLQKAFRELQGMSLPKFQPDNSLLGVLGILSHDGDWLVRKLLNLCLQTVKKGNSISNIYLSSSSSSSSSNLNNNASRYSTTSQSITNSNANSNHRLQSFKSMRQTLLESKKTLITTTMENLQALQNQCEISLAMLRKMIQVMSFYQVNGLVTTFYDFILQPHQTNFSEEGTVSIFLTPISNMIEILAEILSTILLISIIGPIITTLPRIFLRGIISPFLSGPANPILLSLFENSTSPNNTLGSKIPANTASSSNNNSSSQGGPRIGLIKSCLLRLAVTMQQQLLLLIQSVADKEMESRRKITDICSEEFERIRRFIAMIDTPISEIQNFINAYGKEFMEDELKALKMLSSRSNTNFSSSNQPSNVTSTSGLSSTQK